MKKSNKDIKKRDRRRKIKEEKKELYVLCTYLKRKRNRIERDGLR